MNQAVVMGFLLLAVAAFVWIRVCAVASTRAPGPRMLGFSLFVTSCGGFLIVGTAEAAYQSGAIRLASVLPLVALGLGFWLTGPTLAKLAHESNAKSISELLVARFGGARWPFIPLDFALLVVIFAVLAMQAELLAALINRSVPVSGNVIAVVLLAVFALPLLRSSSTSTMSAQEWITVLLVMTFAVTAMLLLGFSGLPPVEVKPRTNDLRSVAILGWLVTPAIWRRLASAPQKLAKRRHGSSLPPSFASFRPRSWVALVCHSFRVRRVLRGSRCRIRSWILQGLISAESLPL